MTRQRRWQIKMVRERKCQICGAPAVTKFLCEKHRLTANTRTREALHKVLLHSCPVRRRLLLEISVTSVGVEKRKLLLNHANETVERFHQRVTLLFASLAVGVVAAFLLEQFGGGLNQVAQRKRLRGHRQNQRSSGSNRFHCETLRGRWLHRWLDVRRDFIVAYRCQQKSQQKLSRH